MIEYQKHQKVYINTDFVHSYWGIIIVVMLIFPSQYFIAFTKRYLKIFLTFNGFVVGVFIGLLVTFQIKNHLETQDEQYYKNYIKYESDNAILSYYGEMGPIQNDFAIEFYYVLLGGVLFSFCTYFNEIIAYVLCSVHALIMTFMFTRSVLNSIYPHYTINHFYYLLFLIGLIQFCSIFLSIWIQRNDHVRNVAQMLAAMSCFTINLGIIIENILLIFSSIPESEAIRIRSIIHLILTVFGCPVCLYVIYLDDEIMIDYDLCTSDMGTKYEIKFEDIDDEIIMFSTNKDIEDEEISFQDIERLV